jgi:hypothetical protein
VNVVPAGNAPWVVSAGDTAATLEIVLQKQTVVLSWHQFIYAEGDGKHVRIAFASHDIVINGAGLDPLVSAIAAHGVVSIRESARSEHFSAQSGRFISEIVVRRVESES